jgi:hypothetical protein
VPGDGMAGGRGGAMSDVKRMRILTAIPVRWVPFCRTGRGCRLSYLGRSALRARAGFLAFR